MCGYCFNCGLSRQKEMLDLIGERDNEWCLALAEIGVAALATSVRGGRIRVEREDADEPPVDLKEEAEKWLEEHFAEFLTRDDYGVETNLAEMLAAFAAHLGKGRT